MAAHREFRTPRQFIILGSTMGIMALASLDARPAGAQERKPVRNEKTSGVIVKIERSQQGEPAQRGSWRLTINTDVVWRDFVRDQAVAASQAARTGTAKAASKGKKSVATEGHPRDGELMVTLEVDPKTEILMRYRSSTDEISEGAATAQGAAKAEEATDAQSKASTTGEQARAGDNRPARKARTLEPMELKPGLWVDVEYQHEGKENRASRVRVMRPVGGPDTPPQNHQTTGAEKTNPDR